MTAKPKGKKVRMGFSGVIGRFAAYLAMGLLAFCYIFPLYMTVLYSMKDKKDLFLTKVLAMPTKLYFGNYTDAVEKISLFTSMSNSLIITVLSVGITVILGLMASYGIARNRKGVTKWVYATFVSGLLIPGQAIFVPTYLVGSKLGFTGHLPGVIFFYVAGTLPFAVFMLTSFLKTTPVEIEEAATIDGAGLLRTIFEIVLPVMKPAIVALAVLRSLLVWNDFLLPKLFLQRDSLQTITVRIANLFGTYRYNMNISFAAMIISGAPIVIFFLYNQKHIEKGIAVGAVKG